MVRRLVRLIALIIVVVAIAAFFIGYRWAGPDRAADTTPGSATATGTAGTAAESRERAREVGAEIGDKVAAGANAAQRAMANGQLTAKIKSKMALDDRIRALSIDVDTTDGVVTLSGTVRSEAERQRAVQMARETDGVRSVVDRLQVR